MGQAPREAHLTTHADASDLAPTAFAGLNHVLRELVIGSRDVLGANFVGAYLQGSFALGAGDGFSDADFLVVLHEDVSDTEAAALDVMHGHLHDLPEEWAQHLEGSYMPARVARTAPVAPYPLLFLDNGARSLVRDEHDNTNVVRWVTRHRGIALAGPPPSTLFAEVTPDMLREEVRRGMRAFGADLLGGAITIDTLWMQGFTVLHCARALHTIATGTVASKPGAVEWARLHLEPSWTPLIVSAWQQRARWPRGRGAPERHAALRPEPLDVAATIAFVGHTLQRLAEVPDGRDRDARDRRGT